MLNEDYKDILSALLDQKAEFILVGAYAMAAHGFPRATMDIDIWVNPTPQNAARVLESLKQFGAPLEGITTKDLSEPGTILQIGVAPRIIDILTSIDAVTFEDASNESVTTDIDSLPVKILSAKHLIENKKATGRTKDQADVETLSTLINYYK